ncbi:MAG: YCF48-related protein [Ignavibacteriaceae bacterium]|nr:YCF48-related protein [Ignavibacteriaceae bacterium]
MKKIVHTFALLLAISSQINAQWFWYSPSPQGNIINDVVMLNPDTIICVGEFGTILRTTDSGQNWNIQNRITENELHKIFFLDSKNGWIAGAVGQALKTTDGGETWNLKNPPTSLNLYDIEFTSINKGFVVGANGYIAKTTNGGDSWQALAPTQKTLFSLQFIDSLNAWAIGDGISRTTNGGVSWFDADPNLAMYYESVFFVNKDTGWISTVEGKILGTTNAGNYWEIIKPDSTIWGYSKIQFINNVKGWICSAQNIVSTNDGGSTWNSVFFPDAISLYSLSFTDQINGFAVGLHGEIYKTTDGGVNWEKKFDRVPFFTANSCFFLKPETGFIGTDGGEILRTTNAGEDWQIIYDNNDFKFWDIFFLNDSLGWASGYPSVILRTIDGGNSWARTYFNSLYHIRSIRFTSDSIGWACNYISGEILYSNDGGLNWVEKTLPVNKYFTKIFFTSIDTAYLMGEDGNILNTTDGGNTWISRNITGQYVNDIFFTDSNHGWAVGYQFISKTTNGGIIWSTTPIPFMVGSCSMIDELRGWIIGEEGEMMYTLDGGNHWDLSYQITNNSLRDLFFIGDDGWIVGGWGTILHTTNGGVTFIEDEENTFAQPKEFLLEQNYPNPFNPSTVISYQLPVSGEVTLKVYDVLGREVATLIDEYRNSGSYEVDFNAAGLTSGVYFYKLTTDNYTETKKMILIR